MGKALFFSILVIAILIGRPPKIVVSEVYPIVVNDKKAYRVVFTQEKYNFTYTKYQIFYTKEGVINFCENVADEDYSRMVK